MTKKKLGIHYMTRTGWWVLAGLLAAWSAPVASAHDVYLRFVDAERGVPLEYWQKDRELPGGGRMAYRMPQKVYADGEALAYATHGQSGDEIWPDAEKEGEGEEAGEELATGTGPPADPDVESDQKDSIAGGMGTKALVKFSTEAGVHTVHPGGLRLKVSEEGEVEGSGASLKKANAESLCVLCYPVDMNLLPGLAARGAALKVASGGHVVYSESVELNRPQVLRLYLPAGEEAYEVEAGSAARWRMQVSASGVELRDVKTEGQTRAGASGFTVFVYAEPAAAATPAAAAEKEAELYLFTDRNRVVYAEGESVWLSLRAYGPPAGAEKVELLLMEGDRRLVAGQVALQAMGAGSAFAELELETSTLRPARYQLQAEAAGTLSNPVPLEIAPVMRATDLKVFSHVKWGDSTLAPAEIERLASLGFNCLSNSVEGYHCSNGVIPGNVLFESLRASPAADPGRWQEYQKPHFPPELLESPFPIAAGMQAMLARQVEFLAVHFPLILYFNVGEHWRDHAEDRYQAVQHLGMHIRHYPNFAGITYATGDGPTPATSGMVWASAGVASFDVIHDERLRKLQEMFEVAFGRISVDTSSQQKLYELTEKDRAEQEQHGLAWGFRVGEEIRMAVQGPEDKALLWGQWVNDLYPENFRQLRRRLSCLIPHPVMASGSTWGYGAGGGMYPGAFYRALDFPLNDMHGDFGLCNFNYVTGTDILNMGMEERGQRPWIGCDMPDFRTPSNAYKLLLQGMSRNPGGMGVLNVHQGDWVCGWAKSKGTSEALASWAQIPLRLGNVFMHLERQDEVAVVSSYRQEVLGGQPFRALWAAHYIAQKAGYQATVITDAYAEKHPEELARRFKALFLFRMTRPLSASFKAALSSFHENGGVVLADGPSNLDLAGVVRLPWAVPDSHGPSNQNDHLEFEDFFLPFIRQFREALAPSLRPYFAFESRLKIPMHEMNFTGIRSQDGDLAYLTVFHDGKPRQGAGGSKMDGTYAQFLYEGDVARVRLAGAGSLYDVLRQSPVEAASAAGGGLEFECDVRVYPGSIYLLSPRSIQALEVHAPGRAAAGELWSMRAEALDPGGKAFSGHLPVEFTVWDSRGVERYRVYRRTRETVELKIAANDPAGFWRWSAWEQATGLAAEGRFEVEERPAGTLLRPLGDVILDAGAVHEFLKRDVEIVLFPGDLVLAPAARELEAGLLQRGVKASLRTLWPSDTRLYPMQWFYRTIEDREIREGMLSGRFVGRRTGGKNHVGTYRNDSMGNTAFYGQYIGSAPYVYYRDVVLIGRSDLPPNPLLEHVLRARMLQRHVSPSFPAAGQGLVGYAWGPFQSSHDAAVVYGHGPAGLERAIASLLRLAGSPEPPAAAPTPRPARLAEENGQVFRSMGLAAPEATAAEAVRSTERRAQSLFPPVYSMGIRGVLADDSGRVFIEFGGPGEATLALADPAKREVKRYVVPKPLRPASVQEWLAFVNKGGWKTWPARGAPAVSDEFIAPVGWGIGRFDQAGRPLWFFDPFPALGTTEEMRYPRRVRRFALTPDGRHLLAAFWNVAPDQGGPSFFNRGDVVLVDAANGNALATFKGYFGHHLALAADASRALVLDLEHPYPGEHNKRKVHNPHEWTGLSLFDASGKELFFVPVMRSAERMVVDPQLRTALLTYNDARRRVTLVDLVDRTSRDLSYPRIDVGAAVSPDGGFAAVAYRDGTVRRFRPDGTMEFDVKLAVHGVPAVEADGAVHVVSPDGRVTTLDAAGQVTGSLDFASAPEEALEPDVKALPGPLERPASPAFWDAPPKGVSVKDLAGGPFTAPVIFTGEHHEKLTPPRRAASQVLLLAFRYQLKDPAGRLVVSFPRGREELSFHFAGHRDPWPASVPLKLEGDGPIPVIFRAVRGATLDQGRLLEVELDELTNVAWVPKPGSPESATTKALDNPNAPVLMVPNIYGQLGDPRCEQMSYGMKGSDVYACFDRDVYSGTDIYEVKYPLIESWTPDFERNLRGAEVVMEYLKPRNLSAMGLWERPGDLPIEAFTLECCDRYDVDTMTKTLKADWRLVLAVRHNAEYFHVHAIPPTRARVWRLTVIRTPASLQRLSEIELYESEAESLFEGDPDGPDASGGGGGPGPLD